jgi:thiol:disulfide interchange protein
MESTPNSPAQDAPKPRRSLASPVFTIAIILVAGLLITRMIAGNGTAPTPDFMPTTTNLASMTFEGDKPVVAVVTADWCGPCQELKRTTLSDERVRTLLAGNAQPVMVDGTDTHEAMPTLQQLGVRAFPSTVVLRNGQPVAMLEGYANADKYLAWLEGQL